MPVLAREVSDAGEPNSNGVRRAEGGGLEWVVPRAAETGKGLSDLLWLREGGCGSQIFGRAGAHNPGDALRLWALSPNLSPIGEQHLTSGAEGDRLKLGLSGASAHHAARRQSST